MNSDISENAPMVYRRFSHVVSRNITYSELMSDVPPTQQEADALDATLLATSHNSARLLSGMATWPRYEQDAYYHEWASPDVAMLMLNGTLDVSTPMAIASEARTNLSGPSQRFLEIPWGAHGAIGQTPMADAEQMPCGMQILLSYVRAPGQEPDLSCLEGLLPVDFEGYADRFGVETTLGTSDLWENGAGTTAPTPLPKGAIVVPPLGIFVAASSADRR